MLSAMVLLYADVLGMRSRWADGVDRVLSTYRRLEQLVQSVVRHSTAVTWGGVQSDAVALTFPSVASAVEVGTRLFLRGFDEATMQERMWLRGLILPCEGGAGELVEEVPLEAGGSAALTARHFSTELLEAVNLEQRFRGPRLLIDETLVGQGIRDRFAIPLGTRFVVPIKQLRYSLYPDGRFADVLYLVPRDVDRDRKAVTRRAQQVSQRMRWAATPTTGGSPEEFAQISALAATWMETEAIVKDVERRA
jgi:hypothetical protein